MLKKPKKKKIKQKNKEDIKTEEEEISNRERIIT